METGTGVMETGTMKTVIMETGTPQMVTGTFAEETTQYETGTMGTTAEAEVTEPVGHKQKKHDHSLL